MSKIIGADNMDASTLDEMINGYSEVISNLVKKHYGLPSEESKYNAARQGIDREEIEKAYRGVVRVAHNIIEAMNDSLNTVKPTTDTKTLNEIRKLVRKILSSN
jgi:hypothetical protein